MAMAQGLRCISGTFTAPNEDTTFSIDFGETFNKYVFLIEMTDDSKGDLADETGITSNKAFCFCGKNTVIELNNSNYNNSCMNIWRYKPSTGDVSISGGTVTTLTFGTTSISNTVREVSYNAVNYWFKGYTYKYFIMEIE